MPARKEKPHHSNKPNHLPLLASILIVFLVVLSISLLRLIQETPQQGREELPEQYVSQLISPTPVPSQTSPLQTRLINAITRYNELLLSPSLSQTTLNKYALSRGRAILTLARLSPQDAYNLLLPQQTRDTLLGRGVRPYLLESPVTVEGQLGVTIADDFQNHTSTTIYTLTLQGTTTSYRLFASSGLPSQSGATIEVTGMKLGASILINNPSSTPAPSGTVTTQGRGNPMINVTDVAAQAVTTGTRKILVLPVTALNNSTVAPYMTKASLQSYFNTLNSFYQENSYGALSVTVTVQDYKQMNRNVPTTCDELVSGPVEQAVYAAHNQLVNFQDYVGSSIFLVFNFPTPTGCKEGYSTVGDVNLQTPDGVVSAGLIRIVGPPSANSANYNFNHEFGHTLGLLHSNLLSCGASQLGPDTCSTSVEYGNKFDIMGTPDGQYLAGQQVTHPAGHISAASKKDLGWFPAASYQIIAPTTQGVYTIGPNSVNPASTGNVPLRSVIIDFPGNIFWNGWDYTIEYRQPVNADFKLTNSGSYNGAFVQLKTVDVWQGGKMHVFDTTPATDNYDPMLLSGQSMTTYDGTTYDPVTIRTCSADANGVTVAVNTGCPNQVAYWNGTQFCTRNINGTGEACRPVTGPPGPSVATCQELAVSPDGSTGVCSVHSLTGNDFYVFNMSSGQITTSLYNASLSGESNPAWHPNGSKIVYVNNGVIYTVAVATNTHTQVSHLRYGTLPGDPLKKEGSYAYPSYSPDGTRLAVRLSSRMQIAACDGLHNVDPNDTWNGVSCGVTKVLYDSAGNYVNTQPVWLDTGTIVFARGSGTITYNIYKIKSDGSGLAQLTTSGKDTKPTVWSQDVVAASGVGAAVVIPPVIAFQSSRTGNNEIFTMNTTGGSQTNITNSSLVQETNPAFPPVKVGGVSGFNTVYLPVIMK